MARRGRALAVAAALLAPAGGGQAQVVAPQANVASTRPYDVVLHPIPSGLGDPINFAVVGAGQVLVPLAGGIFLTDLNGWYVDPGPRPVLSVASAGGRRLYATRPSDADGRAIELLRQNDARKMTRIAELPAGSYDLTAAGDSAAWGWGRTRDGEWQLVFVPVAGEPVVVARSPNPITAATPVGGFAVVAALDSSVVLLRSNGTSSLIARSREPIEGLAIGGGGAVLVSTPTGVYRLTEGHRFELLASDIHGPLRYADRSLYVLSRRHRAVVQLVPKGDYAF